MFQQHHGGGSASDYYNQHQGKPRHGSYDPRNYSDKGPLDKGKEPYYGKQLTTPTKGHGHGGYGYSGGRKDWQGGKYDTSYASYNSYGGKHESPGMEGGYDDWWGPGSGYYEHGYQGYHEPQFDGGKDYRGYDKGWDKGQERAYHDPRRHNYNTHDEHYGNDPHSPGYAPPPRARRARADGKSKLGESLLKL